MNKTKNNYSIIKDLYKELNYIVNHLIILRDFLKEYLSKNNKFI